MSSDEITARTVAEGEKLLGVRYTEPEREQLAVSISGQIKLARERRTLTFPETLAPASRFDPRLPGWSPVHQGEFRPSVEPLPAMPETEEDIAFAPLTALSGWIKAGRLTSVRLTGIYLDRIRRFAPSLYCIATVVEQGALEAARQADALLRSGTWLGPLHGIPWGAKDLLDTAGTPTEWGAEPYRGRVPAADCTVVRLLKSAGAVLIAKTAVGALAYGDVWYGGKCRNPWNPDEGSSGSSAGSASAMAAGLMGFAIGTETGGSIISPAMRCGNTALRPTFGRVSRAGVMPLAWSLDKIGPIARRVEDLPLLLRAVNGFDPADPGSIGMEFGYDAAMPVKGLRAGYFPQDFEAAETPALDRSLLEHARAIGLDLVPLVRPELPYLSLRSMLFAEAAAAFEHLTLSGRDRELGRQDLEAWPNEFRKARFLSAVDYVQLDRLRRQVMELMHGWLEGVDAIIGPSLVGPMLTLTNFTGHPSLVLRTGFIESPTRADRSAEPASGPTHVVPHGISLWGRLFDEGTILRIGRALEDRLGVWAKRPPGFAEHCQV